jgi:hypothetical protein
MSSWVSEQISLTAQTGLPRDGGQFDRRHLHRPGDRDLFAALDLHAFGGDPSISGAMRRLLPLVPVRAILVAGRLVPRSCVPAAFALAAAHLIRQKAWLERMLPAECGQCSNVRLRAHFYVSPQFRSRDASQA